MGVSESVAQLMMSAQPTAASATDFVKVALDCGWAAARDVPQDSSAVREALTWARNAEGPILLRIRVGTEQPRTDFFLEDPVVLGRDFSDWLRQ